MKLVVAISICLTMCLCLAAGATTNFSLSENYANPALHPGVTTLASYGSGVENVIDGDTSTAWFVDWALPPEWIVVDLGEERQIGGVAILCDDVFGQAPKSVRIDVGGATADPYGGGWTTVGSFSGTDGTTGSRAFRFTTTTAQKIRVVVTETGLANTIAIYEVMAMSGTATTQFAAAGTASAPWLSMDGNIATYSNTSASTANSWQIYNIGQSDQVKEVSEFKVHFASSATPPASFRIQHGAETADPYASETDAAWTDAGVFTSNTLRDITVSLSPSVAQPLWRIYTASPNTSLPIAEVEINGVLGAKYGDVSGYVRHATTHEPVPGATVSADSGESTTTASDGSYSLHLAEGSHTLTCGKNYYTTVQATVSIVQSSPATQDFAIDGPTNLAQSIDWCRMPGVTCIASHSGQATPLDTGVVDSFSLGDFSYIRTNGKTWISNQWLYHVIRFTSGALVGREIVVGPDCSNTSTRINFYVEAVALTGVAVGDTYEIYSPAQGLVNDHNYGRWDVDTWDDGWVMVDLGQVRTIGGVSIATYDPWGRAPHTLKIQVGSVAANPDAPETDVSWKTVVDVPNWNRFTNQWAYSFDPVQGQRVRYMYYHYPVDHYMKVDSFSVWSGPAITHNPLGYDGNSYIGDPYGIKFPEYWWAIDGDMNSFSSTYLHPIYEEHWHVLDIGSNATVIGVELHAPVFGAVPWWANIQDVDIQYSLMDNPDPQNNSHWTTVSHYEGHEGEPMDTSVSIDFPTAVRASKWRIYQDSGLRMAYAEIKLIGMKGQIAEDVATIVEAKSKSDGTNVSVTDGKVITGAFSGFFYIEEDDRSNGIKVVSSAVVSAGSRVKLTGALGTQNGERIITASETPEVVGSGTILPLGITNKALGGAGTAGGAGLGNVGLLVRAWGAVVDKSQPGCILIDDGSDLNIKVSTAFVTKPIGDATYVAVTGVLSTEDAGGSIKPVLIPRGDSDVSW